MRIAEFELERFFARWEFAVRHLLCASDVEGWPMADLLELAGDETAALWRNLRLGYVPGSRFGFGGNDFRIGSGREDLPAAIAGLERFLEAGE